MKGVGKPFYSRFTSKDFGESVSVWGTTEGSEVYWTQIAEGDYLLFYIGNEQYRYAAKVIGKEQNSEFADALWPDWGERLTGGNDPGDPWTHIIYLESPTEVDISGYEIHSDFADHKNNYTQRFMRFTGADEIIARFGSVEDYIAARSSDGATEDSSSSQVDREERASDLRPPDRTDVTVSRIIRNTKLVKQLKRLYDHHCQVCGMQLQKGIDEPYAEGHHLQPLGASPPGPDVEENILILCPNHHADFDYGMIRVDLDSKRIKHTYDTEISGTQLTVHDEHDLSDIFLAYHNDIVSKSVIAE